MQYSYTFKKNCYKKIYIVITLITLLSCVVSVVFGKSIITNNITVS